MSTTKPSKQATHHLTSYKMAAQAVGLIVCAFFLFFLIGKGIPDALRGKEGDPQVAIPLMLLPLAGYIITWFREEAGTYLMIAGGIILFVFIWLYLKNDLVSALLYGIPFLLAGSLFYIHIKKKKAIKHQH